jgi:hypothetical protein
LTGTALAARSRDDKRLNDDFSSKVHLQGRVRGRMPRLGKTAMLFAETSGATGLAVIRRRIDVGNLSRMTGKWPISISSSTLPLARGYLSNHT